MKIKWNKKQSQLTGIDKIQTKIKIWFVAWLHEEKDVRSKESRDSTQGMLV